MKEIWYDLYVHIRGVVDAESEDEGDVVDAIFPDGYVGEIQGVTTERPIFGTDGFIEVLSEDNENGD